MVVSTYASGSNPHSRGHSLAGFLVYSIGVSILMKSSPSLELPITFFMRISDTASQVASEPQSLRTLLEPSPINIALSAVPAWSCPITYCPAAVVAEAERLLPMKILSEPVVTTRPALRPTATFKLSVDRTLKGLEPLAKLFSELD